MNIRQVNRHLFDRYNEILKDRNFLGPEKTDSEHIKWMISEVDCDNWEIDKISRWLGFIQGVLVCNGILNVDEERNYTRPLFKGEKQ